MPAASLRDRAAGYFLAILGVAAATAICVALRPHVNPITAALAYLLVVLFTAMARGSGPALVASVLAMLCFNFYFLPPIGTLTIADPENWIALAAFFTTAVTTGQLSGRVKQRAADTRRLARLQAVLADLGERALRSDPSADIQGEVARLVATTLDVEYTNVAELLPGGTEFLLRAGVGWKEGQVGKAIIAVQGSQPGFTLRSERVVIGKDAAIEGRFLPMARMLGESVASTISVVISTQRGPYGTLGAHTRRRRAFTTDELNFLQSVASVLGATIERYRGEDRLRRLNRAYRALSNCNQLLIRADDEPSWLRQVCQVIVETAGYRMCWVGYAERDESKTVRPLAQAGFDEGYLDKVKITWGDTERGRGPTGTCIRTRATSISRNIATDPRLAPWREEARKRGYGSSIALPLLVESESIGALTIYAGESDAFGDDEVSLLTELSGDLAYGITTLRTRADRARAQEDLRALNADLEQRVVARTAELHAAREREVETGVRIQNMLLLDKPPLDVPGLHVAALTIPSQQIDGDFYDFYRHEDQSLDVIVADVMGKGIPAALLGAATKGHFIEALCHLMGGSRDGPLPQPREIVTQAHAEMVRHLIDLEAFVTLCYVRFDPRSRSLTLVDCGHTGLVHWHAATRTCEVLHGDNLPLGIHEGEIYDQLSVSFEANDTLLLFSDGVTEARDRQGEIFGYDRLAQCVRASSGREPRELVEAVREAALGFAGSRVPRDDLTCVAIRVVEGELPLARWAIELRSDLRDLARARRFVRDVCAGLPGAPLDDAAVGKLELAVTEACSNIVKYAYHGRDDQWIRVEVEAYPDTVSLCLRYLGEPFDPSKVPQPALDGSRDSGFGMYLITKSVDDVRYFRDERGWNCVALVHRRGE